MAINYKWTIRFSILTPILIIICVYFIGGGHGLYIPTMVLFPLATLNTIWQDHLSETFLIVGAFQFILYGIIIDKLKSKKIQNLVIIGVFLAHIILAILVLILRDPVWR